MSDPKKNNEVSVSAFGFEVKIMEGKLLVGGNGIAHSFLIGDDWFNHKSLETNTSKDENGEKNV